MRWLLNTVYLLLLTALSPIIAWRIFRHGRYRAGVAEKLAGRIKLNQNNQPIVWFHAVSVGEVIQLQKVVEEFRFQTGDCFSILVSTSTDTGWELAQKRFPGCQLTWFPLDFSWAVRESLDRIQPAMVVLMELELWPNFLAECHRRAVPVAVVNARMSERSHRGYLRIRFLLQPLFQHLSLVAAQSQTYARRLEELGVPESKTHVTGSIKFDGVETQRGNSKTTVLRSLFQLSADDIVLVAGSTQEPEEQMAMETWLQLRADFPNLRLVLVPRHRERFDDVAGLVTKAGLTLMRRSELQDGKTACAHNAVFLLDTIGELSACWGLADIAFVGGSFGNRGGQNMIEPAAYGACILFGPNTWNFRDVVESFRESKTCLQLQRPEELIPTIQQLLNHPMDRIHLGQAAQQVVLRQQGATKLTASLLANVVNASQRHHLPVERAA